MKEIEYLKQGSRPLVVVGTEADVAFLRQNGLRLENAKIVKVRRVNHGYRSGFFVRKGEEHIVELEENFERWLADIARRT
jgi:hypothetical protein